MRGGVCGRARAHLVRAAASAVLLRVGVRTARLVAAAVALLLLAVALLLLLAIALLLLLVTARDGEPAGRPGRVPGHVPAAVPAAVAWAGALLLLSLRVWCAVRKHEQVQGRLRTRSWASLSLFAMPRVGQVSVKGEGGY